AMAAEGLGIEESINTTIARGWNTSLSNRPTRARYCGGSAIDLEEVSRAFWPVQSAEVEAPLGHRPVNSGSAFLF
ncbi:4307_t:CDS:2, partial [Acaulospora colombiana]